MFYVNKVVGWVLSPLGLLFLGCLFGAALRLRRHGMLKRVGTSIVIGSLIVFWVLSCGVTTRFLGVPLEGEESPLVDTLELGGCDVRNTEEEARMIAAAGFKRIRLVTSAWHMPRARWLFERAGLEVRAVPMDYEMHYCAERRQILL